MHLPVLQGKLCPEIKIAIVRLWVYFHSVNTLIKASTCIQPLFTLYSFLPEPNCPISSTWNKSRLCWWVFKPAGCADMTRRPFCYFFCCHRIPNNNLQSISDYSNKIHFRKLTSPYSRQLNKPHYSVHLWIE